MKDERERAVPEVEVELRRAEPARRRDPYQGWPGPAQPQHEPGAREFAHALRSGRWVIAGTAAAALLLGAAYLFLRAPTYAADAVVQVEPATPSLTRLDNLAAALGELPSEAEMEILRSRTLLAAVVEELHLEIDAHPRRFPVVGGAVARLQPGPGAAPAWLGLGAYAWGGERIAVDRLAVSDDLLDAPLPLTALGGGRYEVEVRPGARVQGVVGRPLAATWGDTRLGLFVSALEARPGTGFVVARRRAADVVDGLQRTLAVTERGKKTGILVAGLEGADPVRVAATVNALATSYLRQNVERRSAEAAKTLGFLQSQLPSLKDRLTSAEAALNAYQQQHGVVDLPQETQFALAQAAEVEKELSAVELERSEVHQRFTDEHPQMAALNEKAATLRARLGTVNARMRQLPKQELESARLAREVKVANELYLQVLNRSQELQVEKSGTIGNVRIVDRADVPTRPVRPQRLPVLGVSLLLGLLGGVGGALARKSLDDRASDPEAIERATGVPVYASVPHSARQQGLARRARRGGAALPILAAVDPGDLAIESLRSLRTSLQFALVETERNVVAVGGPGPGLGKSFVTVNLAHVLAGAGQRILLVDADLRRGALHRTFQLPRGPGLSELLTGATAPQLALRRTAVEHLDVLTTGAIPPNPAELLGGARFERLLADTAERYDLVLVDTPPVLAVTDAAIVARAAGVLLLVIRAGQNPIREIQAAVKRFARGGAAVHGVVLNDVQAGGRYARSAGLYHYEYRTSPSN